jgi:hypothetical protein
MAENKSPDAAEPPQDEREEPTTEELEEPSTEKEPAEEPKSPEGSGPEADHQAVGIGVIGGPQVDPDPEPTQ